MSITTSRLTAFRTAVSSAIVAGVLVYRGLLGSRRTCTYRRAGSTPDTFSRKTRAHRTGLHTWGPWVVGDAPEWAKASRPRWLLRGRRATAGSAPRTSSGFALRLTRPWAQVSENFDFNLQQYSITDERKASVDFSSPYYETTQTVISLFACMKAP